MRAPLVSAIVSTYAAERLIDGCLADLVAQTIFGDIEVLVIDSGSPQNEADIVRGYTTRHANVHYIRTEREPLYVAWNRAVRLAKGKYLTSSNTDDRHHPQFSEILANQLEREPELALVYCNQYRSPVENETFAECRRLGRRIRAWPEFSHKDLIERCITGSQPMWRRQLHSSFGMFDVSYQIAADYDMWLRIAERHAFQRIGQTLGVLFESDITLSGASNRRKLDAEILRIKREYMSRPFWRHQPGARRAVAESLFGTGYRYIEHEKDAASAAPFIREAMRLNPSKVAFWKTYALRCLYKQLI